MQPLFTPDWMLLSRAIGLTFLAGIVLGMFAMKLIDLISWPDAQTLSHWAARARAFVSRR